MIAKREWLDDVREPSWAGFMGALERLMAAMDFRRTAAERASWRPAMTIAGESLAYSVANTAAACAAVQRASEASLQYDAGVTLALERCLVELRVHAAMLVADSEQLHIYARAEAPPSHFEPRLPLPVCSFHADDAEQAHIAELAACCREFRRCAVAFARGPTACQAHWLVRMLYYASRLLTSAVFLLSWWPQEGTPADRLRRAGLA